MRKIIIFDRNSQTGALEPVSVDADVFPDRIEIGNGGDTPVEISYPAESQMFGDTLFASYDRDSQTLNPIVRRQLYGTPFGQIETLANQARSRLRDVQDFLKNVASQTDPANVMKMLQKTFKLYKVNLAGVVGKSHYGDVELGGKKIHALIDGGAEICIANPGLFAKSDLRRSSVLIEGIDQVPLRVPAVTVPNLTVMVKNKKYNIENVDFALLKAKHEVLLSVDVQDQIEKAEGIDIWN